MQEKSSIYLSDFLGTLPGNRITVASITEDQLSFAASEGLNSLLSNLAERTYDQAGSYLVKGFDSFIGSDDGVSVKAITNAGRAYIQGFRLQKDLPTTTIVPKSIATKSVRGEQKTYVTGQRSYALNCGPLKQTTQVEAIVEIVSNITRGSVGGGEDLLAPNPVVDILEVSQGATDFVEGTDWQQSGNYVDWIGTGSEPAIGTTYTVRWTYVKQMRQGHGLRRRRLVRPGRVRRRRRILLYSHSTVGVGRNRIPERPRRLASNRCRRGQPHFLAADHWRNRLSHIPRVSQLRTHELQEAQRSRLGGHVIH